MFTAVNSRNTWAVSGVTRVVVPEASTTIITEITEIKNFKKIIIVY
jgi:hypothetical protein